MSTERSDATAAVDPQRLLRDLTSLFALPAFWTGTDPAFVLRTLFEALEALLPLDVCFGVTAIHAGERLQLLRVNRRPASITDAAWSPVVAFADDDPVVEVTREFQIQNHAVRCIRFPIGYVGESARVVLGSTSATFADVTQMVTMRTALSLAAAGLETARLIRERDAAQRAKDEFLAMLGHELRNPLAPIVTALQLMAMNAGGQRSREQIIIERQVNHLKVLVDDLLDISRITRGNLDLRMEPVDVADVVGRALETVAPLMEERRHDVRTLVPRGLVISADPMRMTQVVSNLLTNAAKYTPAGGRVDVVADSHDGLITIGVIDTGIGLPVELLPTVFDVFVQGRQGLARSEGGLGVGLAVVKSLVKAHGGIVGVRSDGPGRGSEFSVHLPAAAGRPVDVLVPAPPVADPEPRGAGRVLVVDDNQDAAELAAAVLSADGHQVSVAHSGFEALQQTSANTFDVVLLDIGLPDLDGYEVAAKLLARAPEAHCQLIAVTGYGQSHHRARSAEAGFTAHLVKPVEPAKLAEAVRRAIESGGVPTREEDAAL